MTYGELKRIETILASRGYRKWTTCLTSGESWGWFKTFEKKTDEDGKTVGGYQVEFRVWDNTQYGQIGESAYGLDVWASPINTTGRYDLTANWSPICSIAKFERLAAEFYQTIMKFKTETI